MANPTDQEFINRIMQAESSGRRYDKNGKLLEGPKTKYGTAKGEMQVLDKTFVDPGFGVTPAKNKSAEERARVGRDYAKAMLERYNDKQVAAMAYNWGPGNVDKWMASGKESAIPKETADYVVKVTGSPIGGQQQVAKKASPFDTAAAPAPAVAAGAAKAPATPPIRKAETAPTQDMKARIAALGPNYHAAMALSYLADNTDEDDPTIQAYRERTEEDAAQTAFLNEPAAPVALAGVDLKASSPFQEPVTAARGGLIHRADGSPEEGETGYFQDPMGVADSGPVTADTRAPGKAPSARAMLDMVKEVGSGAARNVKNLAIGASDTPYDLVGGPVDLVTMAMRPFGYKTEKPVGGSEYLKEKATELGVRLPDSKDSRDQGFRLAGELGASLVNPASATRKIAATGAKLAETGAQVAQAGKEAAQTAKMGAQLGAESAKQTAKGAAKKASDMLKEVKTSYGGNRPINVREMQEATQRTAQENRAILDEIQQGPNTNPPGWTHVEGGGAGGELPFREALPDFRLELQENLARLRAARGEPPPPPADMMPEAAPAPTSTLAVANSVPMAPPVAPPMMATGVSADRPFVGRLDAYVDTLKNPVQLEQLKGQLRGKFRDYDLERVERAFAGMDPKTKLTPDQIKQALAGTHAPSKFVSETFLPQASANWQNADNVWGQPLGTTNLYLAQTPEKETGIKLFDQMVADLGVFTSTSRKIPDPDNLVAARKFLENAELTKRVDPQQLQAITNKFDEVEGRITALSDKKQNLTAINNGFLYPIIYKDAEVAQGAYGDQPYFRFQTEALDRMVKAEMEKRIAGGMTVEQAAIDMTGIRHALSEQADTEAVKKVHELVAEKARSLGIALPDFSLIDWNKTRDAGSLTSSVARNSPEFKENVEQTLNNVIKGVADEGAQIQRFLDPDLLELAKRLNPGPVYKGRHETVTKDKPFPVGFTRFSEHEATIPQMGTVQGRHFHELQSDLSKDMRSSGTTHGSLEKDQADYAKIREQIKQQHDETLDTLRDLRAEKRAGGNALEIAQKELDARKLHDKKLKPLEKRSDILSIRISNPPSKEMRLEEPFAGFETNAALRQQLLLKNAIQSAMRDGKSFATFPGRESSKWKLYVDEETGRSRVEPNLKQVAKDLGGKNAGIDVRWIELPPDANGQPVTALGITWPPSAAERIIKEGVPFAKGGSVERRPDDNRRYL